MMALQLQGYKMPETMRVSRNFQYNKNWLSNIVLTKRILGKKL
jgi:hypothetical protein